MERSRMTRAEKMIAFIETLRTPDGAGVGQPFVLRGWQKAIIREVPRATAWADTLVM